MIDRDYILSTLASLPYQRFLWALLIAALGIAIVHYFMNLVKRVIMRPKVDRTLSQFLISAVRIILYFIIVLIVTDALGIPVSSLIALLSVAGLAVSLSVQNLLSNVVSGIILLISKPFAAGDYIESGPIAGVVSSIDLLYTHINTSSNKALLVPNSRLTASEITNHNLHATRRVDLAFTVPITKSMDDVKRIAIGAAERHPGVLPSPAPTVCIDVLGFDRAEYVLRAWCKSGDYLDVRPALLEAIKRGMEQG